MVFNGSAASLLNSGENRVNKGYWYIKLCNDTLVLNPSGPVHTAVAFNASQLPCPVSAVGLAVRL